MEVPAKLFWSLLDEDYFTDSIETVENLALYFPSSPQFAAALKEVKRLYGWWRELAPMEE